MSDWSAGPQGMLRIVDLTKLLQNLGPLLARRAEGLPAFEIAMGCQWKKETDWTTVRWDGTKLSVEAERNVENAVKLDIQKLTQQCSVGHIPSIPSVSDWASWGDFCLYPYISLHSMASDR